MHVISHLLKQLTTKIAESLKLTVFIYLLVFICVNATVELNQKTDEMLVESDNKYKLKDFLGSGLLAFFQMYVSTAEEETFSFSL